MKDKIKLFLFTVCCGLFALIPEIAMYFVYGMIEPSTTLEKIAVGAIFWFGGGGLCVLFAYLGFMFWALMITEPKKRKR